MARSLDLIVVHHADEASTRGCVEASAAELAELSGLGRSGILVVDNGPTGAVDDLAERDGVDVVAAPRRQGFGANVTFGASRSSADLLLMLNDDARIDAASIERLAAALEEPGVGVAGPRIVDESGSPLPSAWRFPDLAGVAAFALRQGSPPWVQSTGSTTRRVDVLSGAALMTPRELFLGRFGGFDPAFFMFSEDADLCRRMADAGLERAFVPGAVAVHAGQHSTRGLERNRDVEQWRSRSTYWRKHHSPPERAAIRGLYSAAYAIGAAVALARGLGSAAARGRARRLLFLARCALRTPRGPGLEELAAGWSPAESG